MQSKLSKIEVVGLFGYLTYEIDDLDTAPVNFIIAKNGMGKTTILKLLDGLSGNRFELFRRTEFESISFTFSDDTIKFSKDERGKVLWQLKTKEGETEPKKLPHGLWAQPDDKQKVIWLEKHSEIVNRAFCGKHWTVNGHGHYDAKEVLDNTTIKQYIEKDLMSDEDDSIDRSFLDDWKAALVTTDRLKKYENDELENVVNIISNDMVGSMNAHVVKASHLGQEFEHNFLQKLLNTNGIEPNIDDLEKQLNKINSLEDKVKKYGLYPDTDPIKIPKGDLDAAQLKTLKTFLDDKEKRLEPHIDFLKRLELFEELVNVSLAQKSIKPDKDEGIIAERDGKVQLKLDQLSSGEQHLIILAHELIFSIPENTYVLIDEPEISMHLEWQQSFANMLEKIGELRNLRFLCATHSPSIVNSRTSELRPIKLQANVL